jgi:hypothetical protein
MKKRFEKRGDGLVRELENFLVALVNVRWEKGDSRAEDDAEEVLRMYKNYFPLEFVAVSDEHLAKRAREEQVVEKRYGVIASQITRQDIRSETLQKVWILTKRLRRVWNEQNPRSRDWFIFKVRDFYHGGGVDAPQLNLFEQAMEQLQKHAARARICLNRDCPAPYYLSPDFRLRTFCSPICAGPAKREAKRTWWSHHRSAAAKRNKRPRQK